MQKKKFLKEIFEDINFFILGLLMLMFTKMGAKNWHFGFLIMLSVSFIILYVFGHLRDIIEKTVSLEGEILEKKAKRYLLFTSFFSRIFVVLVIFHAF